MDIQEDDIPFHHKYIKNVLSSVRPEYCLVTRKLKSELHMYEAQEQGTITVIANYLFGRQKNREWKWYESGEVSL